MKDIEKIIEVIEKLRPYIIGDGGDLEFIKYENDIVYVKLLGACSQCEMVNYTLKNGIEEAIKSVVPSVKSVERVI